MIRILLYAAPGIAVLVFLSGLDMAVPMLDHWFQLGWYSRVAEGDFRWWQFFEPHGQIHVTAFARGIQTPLAFATGWSFEVEALLNVAIAGATLALALRIARRSESLVGSGSSTAACALMAVLVFSPVLWWAWVWTVAFTHLVINATLVAGAWALTPAVSPLTRARLAVAFVACTLAAWTRVEGLLTWWILIPSLLDTLSRSPGWRRGRVLGAWAGVALLLTVLQVVAVTAPSEAARVQAATPSFEPWTNLVLTLNLLGAPVAGFLQAVLPDVADSRRYAPAGVLVLLAYVLLAIRFAAPRRSHLRPQTLPWLTLGLFGLAFSAAIGLTRVGVMSSGLITFAYVSTYATTATLTAISVLQLGILALADGTGRRSTSRGRRATRVAIATVAACLAASYVAIVPTAVAERSRWRGREACFELAGYLDFRNSCFVKGPVPEKLETLARLGFRDPPRTDLAFIETPKESRGALERAVPSKVRGYLRVEGRIEPSDPASGRSTILLGRAGQRSFFARGVSESSGSRFALSVPDYVLPKGGGAVHAWVYEPERSRFVRLEGVVELAGRRTRWPHRP